MWDRVSHGMGRVGRSLMLARKETQYQSHPMASLHARFCNVGNTKQMVRVEAGRITSSNRPNATPPYHAVRVEHLTLALGVISFNPSALRSAWTLYGGDMKRQPVGDLRKAPDAIGTAETATLASHQMVRDCELKGAKLLHSILSAF
jgi:hypothetical protein